MAGKIFINYRRGDDPGYTQALFQLLEVQFGRDQLFMDVEGYIKAGDDFVRELDTQVASCDVLLAIIGPRWMDARDEKGHHRLDDPDDFVRIEIVSALGQDKRVIPVLVNNACMPHAKDLPEPLRPLATRNAVRLTQERFSADCQGLIKDVRDALCVTDAMRRGAVGTIDTNQRPVQDVTIKLPQSRNAPQTASYLLISVVFLGLGGVSIWMTSALMSDESVSRILVLLLALAAAFFFLVGVLALRHYTKGKDRTPGARQL